MKIGRTLTRALGAGVIGLALTSPASQAAIGTAERISPAATAAGDLDADANGNGRGAVAWSQGGRVYARIRAADGSFPAVPVDLTALGADDPGTRTDSLPDVAVDPEGTVHVAFLSELVSGGTTDRRVMVATRDVSASGFTVERVSQGLASPSEDPELFDFVRIAEAPDGAATVAWRTAAGRLLVADRPAATMGSSPAFGPAVELAAEGAAGPDVARQAGVTTVAWSASRHVLASSRASGGAFDGSQLVDDGDGTALESASQPRVVVRRDGTTAIVFVQRSRATGTDDVLVAERVAAAGAPYGTPVEVAASATDEFSPAVDEDFSGDLTIAWMRGSTPASFAVAARHQVAEGPVFSDPELVSDAGGAVNPSVAVGPGDDAVISWNEATESARVLAALRPSGSAPFDAPQVLTAAGDTGAASAAMVGGAPQSVATVAFVNERGAEGRKVYAASGPVATTPTVSFGSSAYEVDEGGALTVTLTRPDGGGQASVHVESTGGTATSGTDFTAVDEDVSFADGATSATLQVAALGDTADEPDERFTLAITGASGDAAPAEPSTATVDVRDDDAPPTADPDQPPRIAPTGAVREGDTLTAQHGGWSTASGAIVFSYQWERCATKGSTCSSYEAIGGATAQTYELTAGDVDRRVRVQVTATNDAGATTRPSAPTAQVLPLAPANSSPPPLPSGSAREGQTLTAGNGTWASSSPITGYRYQWQRCAASSTGSACDAPNPIAGATSRTYTLAAADVGLRVRVLVAAVNRGGAGESSGSPVTEVVAPASEPVPVNEEPPAVKGTAIDGAQLSVDPGEWTGENLTFAYRWQRCTEPGAECAGGFEDIEGAAEETYRLTPDDVGRRVRVVETASNTGGSAERASEAAGPVAAAPPQPSGTGPVVDVDGGAWREGATARVTSSGSWSGTPTIRYEYAWQRCTEADDMAGTPCTQFIDGASGETYVLGPDDVGAEVRAVVTATNAAGSASRASNRSPQVSGAGPRLLTAPMVELVDRNDDPRVGERARYVAGGYAGRQPLSVAFRWIRCPDRGGPDAPVQASCQDIPGATGTEYDLTDADIGSYVGVRERAEDPDGVLELDSVRLGRVSAHLAPPGPPPPPSRVPNGAGPQITGDAVVGKDLVAKPGDWLGGASFTYKWYRCGDGFCKPVLDGPATYRVSPDDLHHVIILNVVARNIGGTAEALAPARKVLPAPEKVDFEDEAIGLDVGAAKDKIERMLRDGEKTQVTFSVAENYVADKDLPRNGKGIEVGEVYSTKPNTATLPTPEVKVKLKVWLGTSVSDPRRCAKLRSAMKSDDLDSAIETLRAAGCPIDDLLLEKSKKVDEPELKDCGNGRRPDCRILVPAKAEDYDLFAVLGYGTRGLGQATALLNLGADDWALTAGEKNSFGVTVVDRAGRRVNGVKVTLDGAKVGVQRSSETSGNGATQFFDPEVRPTGEGTIDILLEKEVAGEKLYGFGQVRVKDRNGASFQTIIGEKWDYAGRNCKGNCYVRDLNVRSSATAADLNSLFAIVNNLITSFGADVQKSFNGARESAARLNTLAQKHAIGPVQFLLGQVARGPAGQIQPLFSTANLWQIDRAGNVISTGGGNVISTGGGNVISVGGGNVISTGGGNVISTGGGNVISTGGGNFKVITLPNDGGKVIATGGGNVIATGGGNVIATGGGN